MTKIQELRKLHDIYNKHEGDICISCLKGLETVTKKKMEEILPLIPYTPQEIAESMVPLSYGVIMAIKDKVNWETIKELIVFDLSDYNNLTPEIKSKALIYEILSLYDIKEPVNVEKIISIMNEYGRNPNIAELIVGNEDKKKELLVYNPININRNNLKYFLKYPNLFVQSFIPLPKLKEILSIDIKYLAYIYPRSVVRRFNLIEKVPEEVIDLIKKIDNKLNLRSKDLNYSLINTDPKLLFEYELFSTHFKFKGKTASGEKGFMYGGNGIMPRRHSRYYINCEVVDILGYEK